MSAINWKNSDSFYNNEHHQSAKPVLLFIHSDQLDCCEKLDSLLEEINTENKILENFFLIKVSSHTPSENDKRLINNHIFVASPILQVLNHDGSRSHEFSYVPRQTRHSKGYSYTHNENDGIFTKDLISSQLEIGLAKFHYFNSNTQTAISIASNIISKNGVDENANRQAALIIEEKQPSGQSTFLDSRFNFTSLSSAVTNLLKNMQCIKDKHVMKEWPYSDGDGDWKWYTDCVRELSFQIYQELITASNKIEIQVGHKRENKITHLILSNWHQNYRKLQADFIGVPDNMLDIIALKHERSLRENIVHCILCEGSAHGLQILNAINGENNPECIISFETHQETVGEVTADIGPSSELFSHYENVHSKILNQLKHIKDDEIKIKSKWWEPENVSLQFRLERLGWHLQDHICTHRKLLAEMNFKPNLVDTFSQVIFEGLAKVECSILGYENQCRNEISALISKVHKRSEELHEFSNEN